MTSYPIKTFAILAILLNIHGLDNNPGTLTTISATVLAFILAPAGHFYYDLLVSHLSRR